MTLVKKMEKRDDMEVTGIGGVFLRTTRLEELKEWYRKVFKLSIEDWNGTIIKPQTQNETVFSFFDKEDTYFPLDQSVMLNFQIDDMDAMLIHLKELDIPLVKDVETSDYGTFARICDPEGRWIEIWAKSK
jgi:predicted enzyme related to lactoylglutathione lyase